MHFLFVAALFIGSTIAQRGGGGGKGGGGGGKGAGGGGKGAGVGGKGGGGHDTNKEPPAPCTSSVQGNPCPGDLKCYFGECIESDGPGNMCGGRGEDENCKECFECNIFETSCKAIDGCVQTPCEVDDDCERNDVCFQNDCALPDRIPGECTGTGNCDGLKFMDCRDEYDCEWTDDSRKEEVTALVATWQSLHAVEWTDSMTVLAVSAAMVTLLYTVYMCIARAKAKSGYYEEINGDDAC